MTRQQKIQGLALLFLAIVLGAVPAFVYLRYGKKLLPISDFFTKKLILPVTQLPFTTLVAPDNSMVTRPAANLSEEQKIGLATGLAMVFHVRADNLAHYFPYFTMVQFGSGDNIWALATVFSSDIPRVGADANTKTVSWKGQYIAFDLTRRQMVYAVDNVFEFKGTAPLEVSVHGSVFFLESGAVEPQFDPRRIMPTVPGERF